MRCRICALGSMFLLSHALAEPFQIELSRNQVLASVEDISQAAQGKIESLKTKAGEKVQEVKQEARDARELAGSAIEKASDNLEGVSDSSSGTLSSIKKFFSGLFGTKDTE